jgi:putative endonuclease
MFFVYILRTSTNRLYIGVTENLDQRISTHNSGKGAEWIKADRDARRVYSEPHPMLGSARKREIQLKKWSRKKKEALIAGDFAKLKSLSRCLVLSERSKSKGHLTRPGEGPRSWQARRDRPSVSGSAISDAY